MFPSHKRAYAVPFALYINGFVVLHVFPSVEVCKVNPVIVVETVTFTFPFVQPDVLGVNITFAPAVGDRKSVV